MKKIFYISTTLYILLTSITYSEVIEVSNSQLKSLLENNVPIIDIRREEEWKATGIIENSILMTFFDKNGKPNTSDWLNKLNQTINEALKGQIIARDILKEKGKKLNLFKTIEFLKITIGCGNYYIKM